MLFRVVSWIVFLRALKSKNSGSEALSVFGGIDEAEDHVTEVARISVQRVQPVLETDRVRVAPQVTKVLH